MQSPILRTPILSSSIRAAYRMRNVAVVLVALTGCDPADSASFDERFGPGELSLGLEDPDEASSSGSSSGEGDDPPHSGICGDAIVGPGEICDDGVNDGKTSGCLNCVILDAFCGNGVVETNEACDDGNTVVNDGCDNHCQTNVCGDAVVQDGEQCDGPLSMSGALTCAALGYTGGEITCDEATCLVDLSQCFGCGDGVVQADELCDTGIPAVCDLQTSTMTVCGATCNAVATVPCSVCGDHVIDEGEACDGMVIAGDSCTAHGFSHGSLACSPTCELDTSACSLCGDDVADANEPCDGADLRGQSCASMGLVGGELGCTPGCDAYDASLCTSAATAGCCEVGACTITTFRDCVCAMDASCCEESWDEACVAEGIVSCGMQC